MQNILLLFVKCLEKYNNPGDMQKVMEVYDLNMDIEKQLKQCRCHKLKKLSYKLKNKLND